jgi:hypothetical protein
MVMVENDSRPPVMKNDALNGLPPFAYKASLPAQSDYSCASDWRSENAISAREQSQPVAAWRKKVFIGWFVFYGW